MQKIVFYDGDCGFCNKSVQFILTHEKSHEICFSALQSDFAKQFFIDHKLPEADLSTFYFWNETKLYQKSTGALKVLNDLTFWWKFLKVGYLLPRALRDKMYDFIAKRRHRLSAGFCAFPTPEQKLRFLSSR